MICLKIGGSTLKSDSIAKCLNLITSLEKKILVIPGGGEYANLVRKEQKRLGFDDLTAHNLCILSMIKVSMIFNSLIKVDAEFIKNIKKFSSSINESLGIWLPENEIAESINKYTNWENTSDSIALMVSKKINAKALVIIKSCVLPKRIRNNNSFALNKIEIEWLSNKNILDKAFPKNFSDCKIPIYIISIQNLNQLELLLRKL